MGTARIRERPALDHDPGFRQPLLLNMRQRIRKINLSESRVYIETDTLSPYYSMMWGRGKRLKARNTKNAIASTDPVRRRSWHHSLARSTLRLFLAILLLVGTLCLALQIPPVALLAARTVFTLANPWPGTTASLENVQGTWLTSLTLCHVRISKADQTLLVSFDTLRVRYDLTGFLHGEIRIGELTLRNPIVRTGKNEHGVWMLSAPFGGKQEKIDSSAALILMGDRLLISGGEFELLDSGNDSGVPLHVKDLTLSARSILISRGVQVSIDTLHALYLIGAKTGDSITVDAAGEISERLLAVKHLSVTSPRTSLEAHGRLSLPITPLGPLPEGVFSLSARPLAYRDIHPFIRAIGPEGQAVIDLQLTGDGGRFTTKTHLGFTRGGSVDLSGSAWNPRQGILAVDINARTQAMRIGSLTGTGDPSESLTSSISLRGEGPSLEDARGTATVHLTDSHLAGLGPLNAVLNGIIDSGTVRADLRGTMDRLVVALTATIAPFTAAPVYTLAGSLDIPSSAPSGPQHLLSALAGLRCRLTASGEGLDPATGTGTLQVDAGWEGNPHFRSFALRADLSGTVMRANVDLTTHSGKGHLRGFVRFAEELQYGIDSLMLRTVDLAALLGDSTALVLNGTLTARGRGSDPRTLSGEAAVHLSSSRYAWLDITNAEIRAALNSGTLQLLCSSTTSGGEVSADLQAEPFAESPSVTLTALAFRDLDLGTILHSPGLSTHLQGTLRGDARCSSTQELDRLLKGLSPSLPGSVRANVELVLERSRFNSQLIDGRILVALRDQKVSLDADLRTPEGGVSAQGEVALFGALPGFDVSHVSFERIDIGKIAGIEKLTTDLSGAASARLTGSTLDSADASVSLTLSRSLVNKEPLVQASLQGVMDRGTFDVTGSALFGRGEARLKAQGRFSAGGVEGILQGSTRMDEIGNLLALDSLSGSSLLLDFAADGSWGGPGQTNMRGWLTGQARLDSVRCDSIDCRLSVLGRTINVDTLLLRSNAGLLTGRGVIAAFDNAASAESDFVLSGSVSDLKPFERLTGLRSGPFDGAGFSLSMRGPPSDTRVQGRLHNHVAAVEDVFLSSLDASASATFGRGLALRSLDTRTSFGALSYGSSGIEESSFQISSDSGRYRFDVTLGFEDTGSARLKGTIRREGDNTLIQIEKLTLDNPAATWNLDQPTSVSIGRKLLVSGFSLRSGQRRVFVDGILDPEGEQDFSLIADSLNFRGLARILGRSDLAGSLSMNLRITGPSTNASANGVLNAELEAGGRPVGNLRATVDWADSLLRARGIIHQPGGSQLVAEVSIPRPLTIGSNAVTERDASRSSLLRLFDGTLQTENFDLAIVRPFLNPKSVGRIRGLLSADIRASGSRDSLQLSGKLAIDSGQVYLSALGVPYSKIRLRSSLQGSEFVIDDASLSSGDGSLLCRGRFRVDRAGKILSDLHITAENFVAAQTATLKGTASGEVDITGPVTSPTVSGKVFVRDSYFNIPELGASSQVESVELSEEDYAMLEKWFAYRRRAVSVQASSPPLSLTLDLDVAIERNTWIRKRLNPTLAVELEGNLALKGRPNEQLSIVGNLRPMTGRSYVGQFGRQFDITQGEIAFNGRPEDLELRLGSEYKAPSKSGTGLAEVVIRMDVEYRLGRSTFRLTSDPSMEESDILSYLATGKSSRGALANTADQGNLGSAVALEQLVGAAGGITEGIVPLDVFQIRQDGARGITIVAGNYVTPKAYLGIRQPILFSQGTQDTYYDTATQFEVEYQASPWAFINFQGGSTRVLLFLKSRYAY
jgi:translocation and assembly module TamB